MGLLTSTFTDQRERGRAFAVYGAVSSGGAGVGLILGGVLTEYLSWRYTLYVNLIFAAFAIAGALAYVSASRAATRPRLDWPGTVLASAGLFLIVFGFSRAEIAGWTAPLTITCLVVGPLLLAAFVLAERRSAHPLLPLRVILDRTRGGSFAVLGLTGIALLASSCSWPTTCSKSRDTARSPPACCSCRSWVHPGELHRVQHRGAAPSRAASPDSPSPCCSASAPWPT